MLDITRMLTDKKFRKETLSYCRDTVVLQFWNIEFDSWTEKFQAEAIAPVLNKVGAFTANPIIRNIIGQPKSTFNIRQMMDEGKILIVNLSKGLIGEDNASILGAFLVTKVQLAAMSRSDIPNVEDRRPFYLYVDEFQNFATDSFATILSEARKYGLNLTVANQYISQMSDTVRDAVFGNVGTMISFRISADDAPILAKQFEPQFEAQDLLQMHNRNFIINMVINGEKAPAFSARTLNLPTAQSDNTRAIIENTRANYSQPRNVIEEMISNKILPPQSLQTKGKGNPEYTANQKKFLEGEGIAFEEKQDKAEAPALPPLQTATVEPIQAQPAKTGGDGPQADNTPAEGEGKKKRKRSRSRKKKTEGNADSSNSARANSQQTAIKDQPPLVPAEPAPEPSTMLKVSHPVPTAEPKEPSPKPVQPPQTQSDPTLLKIR
jgi:hypothetical protein